MLGDDLEPVICGRLQFTNYALMYGVSDSTTVFPRLSTTKRDAHERHIRSPSPRLSATEATLFDAELLAGVGAEPFRRPLRIPDQLDSGIAYSGYAQQPLFDLIGNVPRRRTTGCCK